MSQIFTQSIYIGIKLSILEVRSDHILVHSSLSQTSPEIKGFLVVDLIQEVHAMISDSRKQDAEGSLETGGSCSGLTNTYHLDTFSLLKCALTLTCKLEDLLEI